MKAHDLPCVGVIIPAAGFGSRMGAALPKQFLELAGMPLLAHALRAFLSHPAVHAIVAVLPPDYLQSGTEQLLPFLPMHGRKVQFAAGGATRQQSVRNGLAALPAEVRRILVHDGARPLVTAEIIDRCVEGMERHGAVITAVPVRDTLKEVKQEAVLRTVDRERLWQAQTPQGMERHLLEQAYRHAEASGFTGTDEASLLEHAGIPVAVVMGSEQNLKITRPDDLRIAAGLLRQEDSMMLRIGHGFDAHRLVEGRKLILGGQEIPFHLGLEGHSDADVLAHALMDAILGALGEGDIGRHFPDTDERCRGADSLRLLAQVMQLAGEKRMRLVNADITVICQRPKLAPYMAAMKNNIAAVCAVAAEQINMKATTTEKMGYTGRGEGISAHAVALLRSVEAERHASL